jgi:Kef-type K+ transport system membrane component KefB
MRRVWRYPIVMAALAVVIVASLYLGDAWLTPADPGVAHAATAGEAASHDLTSAWRGNMAEPLAQLLLQIGLIMVVARALGAVARKLGQPAVIGEMAAGIALGPSLFGVVAPAVFARVFPASSLAAINVLGQVGVIIFLFGVGLDFDWRHVRHRARVAVVVSNAAILLPFLLGVGAALFLYRQHAPPGTTFSAFALFMGIAMSITAFPVLARILSERGMLTTPVGLLALTCAAVGDVTAWTLLAFVVAVVTSGGALATVVATSGLTAAFIFCMAVIVRPLTRRLFVPRNGQDPFSSERVASAVALMCGAALATQVIGVHALFGAFVAGATLPGGDEFRAGLRQRLEAFSSVMLLPLFFAYTGLRTEIGLFNNVPMLLTCLTVILLATAGKLGGSAIAGRAMGLDGRTAFALGVLMNTRGLMELIALNVGYDLGVISREIFTVLVLMALVTTAMTGPLVDAFWLRRPPARP